MINKRLIFIAGMLTAVIAVMSPTVVGLVFVMAILVRLKVIKRMFDEEERGMILVKRLEAERKEILADSAAFVRVNGLQDDAALHMAVDTARGDAVIMADAAYGNFARCL